MTPLDALLDWYANLTPATLGRVADFYATDAHFHDPFNDVHGIPAIETVFRHMFAHTDQPRFEIASRMADGDAAFVTWVFTFGLRGRAYRIPGASHLRFAADGRVQTHRDYWDPTADLWQHLPLVGAPVRWLRRRFKAA